jgi:hypothetical protein
VSTDFFFLSDEEADDRPKGADGRTEGQMSGLLKYPDSSFVSGQEANARPNGLATILFLANIPWFGGVKEEEYLGATAAKKKVVQVQARLKNAFIVARVYGHLPSNLDHNAL